MVKLEHLLQVICTNGKISNSPIISFLHIFSGILCDLTSFSSGSPMSDCSGHQFEICDMMCESGNMVRVECGNSGAWNDTNPCSGNVLSDNDFSDDCSLRISKRSSHRTMVQFLLNSFRSWSRQLKTSTASLNAYQHLLTFVLRWRALL